MACTCHRIVDSKSILPPPSLPPCFLLFLPPSSLLPFLSFTFALDGDIGLLSSLAAVLCHSRLPMQTNILCGLESNFPATEGQRAESAPWRFSLEVPRSLGASALAQAANGLRMDSDMMTQPQNAEFTGGAMVPFIK